MQHFKHLLNWHIISIEAAMTFCFCSIYTGCNDVIKFDSISCHHVVWHACLHRQDCPYEILRTKWTDYSVALQDGAHNIDYRRLIAISDVSVILDI